MNTENKVGAVCFMAAVIGTLVARELWHSLWWVGMLLGGAIGYLSNRPKQAMIGVKTAWEEMLRERPWPDVNWGNLRVFISGWLAVVLCVFSWSLLFLKFQEALWMSLIVGSFFTLVFGPVLCIDCEAYTEAYIRLLWHISTVALVFYTIPLGCYRLFQFITPKIIPGCRALMKFISRVFVLIHSEERFTCMVYSMLGVIVGYFSGSAIAGGVVGAVCGKKSYRFASARWPKQVPAK